MQEDADDTINKLFKRGNIHINMYKYRNPIRCSMIKRLLEGFLFPRCLMAEYNDVSECVTSWFLNQT